MYINFSKMHGLGNDFMVMDSVSQNQFISREQIKQLADRHFGIGFDQLLVVEPPYHPEHDFHYRIFNADGSEVEQCGNGARCFASFVYQKGLTNKKKITVSTKSGTIVLQIEKNNHVTVNMGQPILAPSEIPFKAKSQERTYLMRVKEQTVMCGVVSMGNPHCVLTVDDIDNIDINILGAALERHERFPNRVNVGFMQIIDRNTIKLRVFERGVGETLACGTGACAAAVIGQLQDKLDTKVTVSLPGGDLTINWQPGQSVMMTGPAVHVFDGQINI